MFWGDRVITDILNKKRHIVDGGGSLIIRDEKTMSGRVHVGSLRGVAIHGILSELLNDTSGPKAGWFLSVLGKQFLIRRIEECLA